MAAMVVGPVLGSEAQVNESPSSDEFVGRPETPAYKNFNAILGTPARTNQMGTKRYPDPQHQLGKGIANTV